MVAFVCIPPKKSKQSLEEKPAQAENVEPVQQEAKVEGQNVQEYTVGRKDDFEQASRGFDTLFGFIYLSLIFVYTAAEFFAFFWAFSN